MGVKCYKCSADTGIEANINVVRSESCESCLTDLRCCRMCFFYDKNSYNECRETSADRVQEKEKSNFCDFYKINDAEGGITSTRDNMLSAADALFKK